MRKWLKKIQSESYLDFGTLSLILSIGFMMLAIINPSIPLKHNIYNYMFVTDISQSMNTVDMSIMNKPTSRLEYMKHTLHEIMSELPCGTKAIGWALRDLAYFDSTSVSKFLKEHPDLYKVASKIAFLAAGSCTFIII